ncbi:AIG2-like family protein [Desulfotomaculum arcticum]|uniref:AIG2-like family protein n=1 Tax=Desulfotruncus arcticus DSM 17038 TaxID=1121424 RepID=A0A1I2W8A6_9FIRM|nr:gamma-glutamylcyclotransferase family protein [Desulfotruncus arcticus]SFG95751.1 AIG2-like family protein [Desulfotomaculum arcticum] [Desulfotruncus arcticus DSM 17038]
MANKNLNLHSLLLGLIRDVDNALPFEIITRRLNIAESTAGEVINDLLHQNLIRTFPDDLEKPAHHRRYFICKESLDQVRSMVHAQMVELSNSGNLYFAYGSDLHPGQCYRDRRPDSHFLMRGEIRDYRLNFPIALKQWSGGVAGITYSEDDSVWGAAFYVTDEHWTELDRYAGVSAGFKRIRVPVRTHFGIFCMESHNAISAGNFLPSADYLNHIIAGAEFFGLPYNYINRIKNTPYLGERKR